MKRLLLMLLVCLSVPLVGSAQPGGFGGPPGGPPGMQEKRAILKEFDKNNDGWLNDEERKLSTFEDFKATTADDVTTMRGREMPLRAFADQRKAYLLKVTEGK